MFPAGYGAVFLDESQERGSYLVAGACVSTDVGEAELARQNNSHLVVLAHPCESAILNSLGFSWTTLAWVGRFVQVHRVVCAKCGTFVDLRKLTAPPAAGCMLGLVVGLASEVLWGLWTDDACVGFATWIGVTVVTHVILSMLAYYYVRLRFRVRASSIDGPSCCPNCLSEEFVRIPRRGMLPCPECGNRTMRIWTAGKS
jgi:hypothetical protein